MGDLFRDLAEQVAAQAREPNILAYEPHDKQKLFHTSDDYSRLYIGGNRSGKTFGSVVEDIWWATKTHPHRKLPSGQIRGRVCAVDFDRGVKQILLPIFKRLLSGTQFLVDGSWDASWREGERVLTFANGSFIEFMSYEQETEKFAGTSRHFIHYDEEPPKNVYDECQARLVDTNGSSWISMTPVEGATWVFDKIYEPVLQADDREDLNIPTYKVAPAYRSAKLHRTIVEVGMNENPHLSAEAAERFLAELDEDDKKARSKGTFVTAGGLVFKNFSVTKHVIQEEIDPAALQRAGWQIYTSTDHGWNCPTAWLWHAVAPYALGGNVITFGEHYESEMTIEEHARTVILKEQAWGLDTEEIIRTGDPAMDQHSGITGTTIIQEYAKHGLWIGTASVPRGPGSSSIGIGRMQMYFKLRGAKEEPVWKIHASCGNFVRELKKLKWKTYSSKKQQYNNNKQEQVHKKDDHAFDSAKYFATFLDELQPDDPNVKIEGLPFQHQALSYDTAILAAVERRESDPSSTQWTMLERVE